MMMVKVMASFKYWFIDCDNDKVVNCGDEGNDYRYENIDDVCLNDGEDEEDDDNDGNNDDEFNDDTDGKDGECHDDGDSFSLTLFYDFVNIIYISEVYFAGSSYPNSLSAWKTEDMPSFIYVSVTLLSKFHII